MIAASAVASLLVAPDPATAIGAFCTATGMSSLKISNLFSWLPDKFKFGRKDREDLAMERYELSGVASFMLFNIAIRDGFEAVIIPVLQNITAELNLNKEEKIHLTKVSEEADLKIQDVQVAMHVHVRKEDIVAYGMELISPLIQLLQKKQDEARKSKKKLEKIDLSKLKNTFLNSLWCDTMPI